MAWRKEIEHMEPIDKALFSKVSNSLGRTLQKRRCSFVTRNPMVEPIYCRRRQQAKRKTDYITFCPLAEYQRRHDEKGKISTGEVLLENVNVKVHNYYNLKVHNYYNHFFQLHPLILTYQFYL